MNTTTTTEHQTLITRLIQSFTDHHRELVVDFKELPGRVDWTIKTHIDDQSKVIGRSGTHFKALQFLVWAMGDKADVDYHLRLISPEVPARRKDSEPRQVDDYDPTSALQLLVDLLSAILEDRPGIETVSTGGTNFVFKIIPACHKDDIDLQSDGEANPLLSHLGALYRAYGNSQGVTFKISRG